MGLLIFLLPLRKAALAGCLPGQRLPPGPLCPCRWDFNSLFPAPKVLSILYMETFLATLKQQVSPICSGLSAGAASCVPWALHVTLRLLIETHSAVFCNWACSAGVHHLCCEGQAAPAPA